MPVSSVPEVLEALRNAPMSLLGTPENEWLDFKGEPYRLDEDWQKLELAKDVTSLANKGQAGILVIGFRTEKDQLTQVDKAAELKPVPNGLIKPQQVRDVVRDWVFPRLDIDVVPYPVVDEASLWSITAIPKERDTPYLITGELIGNGISKRVFSLYERDGSDNVPFSPQQVHGYIRRGYRPLTPPQEILAGPPTLAAGGADDQLADAILESDITDLALGQTEALYYIQAMPTSQTTLSNFYEGLRGSLWDMLFAIPSLRRGGFNLPDGRTPERIPGGLRTLHAGQASLSVSEGGITTTVLGEYILTWAHEQFAPGLAINVLALAEYTLEFWRFFFLQTMLRAESPSNCRWRVGLRHLKSPGMLTLPKYKGRVFSDGLAEPLQDSFASAWQVSEERDPGKLAFLTLREMYASFGLDANIAVGSKDGRIDEAMLFA